MKKPGIILIIIFGILFLSIKYSIESEGIHDKVETLENSIGFESHKFSRNALLDLGIENISLNHMGLEKELSLEEFEMFIQTYYPQGFAVKSKSKHQAEVKGVWFSSKSEYIDNEDNRYSILVTGWTLFTKKIQRFELSINS